MTGLAPRARWHRSPALFAAALVTAVALGFWAYTGQVWEDFLITYRSSQNLADGLGLSHEPGTRVHSFTSPINVLLPALFAWLTGAREFPVPLSLYTLVSIAALATGAALLSAHLARQARTAATPAIAAWVFPALLVFSTRTVAYATNGQEAGFWVLFLAVSFVALHDGLARRWPLAALGWCGLMWTRPDSPVHILAFMGLALLWPAQGSRREEAAGLAKAAALCALGYLPWFAGAWIYYGSPVPHSIVAKLGAYRDSGLPWGDTPFDLEKLRDAFGGAWAPIYGTSALTWGSVCLLASASIGAVAGLACLFPRLSRGTRLAAALTAWSIAYLVLLWVKGIAFPWYFVPPALFGALVWARLPEELSAAPRGLPSTAAKAALIAFPLVVAGQFFASSLPLIRAHQQLVESGVRREIGFWLRDRVRPDERVFLEPCGYIGYFSGARLHDFPGLTSPRVVAERRAGAKFLDLVDRLEPTWIVFRAAELEAFKNRPGAAAYELAAIFDQREAIHERSTLRGIDWLRFDSVYFVLRRRPAPTQP
jgi:hypothetical protein